LIYRFTPDPFTILKADKEKPLNNGRKVTMKLEAKKLRRE